MPQIACGSVGFCFESMHETVYHLALVDQNRDNVFAVIERHYGGYDLIYIIVKCVVPSVKKYYVQKGFEDVGFCFPQSIDHALVSRV